MCCDGYDAHPEDAVGVCPECGGNVDVNGETVDAGCNYSPRCKACGSSPCDQSC